MPTETDIVTLGLGLVGGGGAVKLVELWFNQKKEAKTENKDVTKAEIESAERMTELVITKLAEQRDDAFARARDLQQDVTRLEVEIQGLKLSQGLEPFPRWMVDVQLRLIFVNRCFEEKFLTPSGKSAGDIIGKRVSEIWPPDVEEKLIALNMLALQRPDGRAKGIIRIGGHRITVFKIPVRHRATGAIMAHEGWAVDMEVDDISGTGSLITPA